MPYRIYIHITYAHIELNFYIHLFICVCNRDWALVVVVVDDVVVDDGDGDGSWHHHHDWCYAVRYVSDYHCFIVSSMVTARLGSRLVFMLLLLARLLFSSCWYYPSSSLSCSYCSSSCSCYPSSSFLDRLLLLLVVMFLLLSPPTSSENTQNLKDQMNPKIVAIDRTLLRFQYKFLTRHLILNKGIRGLPYGG